MVDRTSAGNVDHPDIFWGYGSVEQHDRVDISRTGDYVIGVLVFQVEKLRFPAVAAEAQNKKIHLLADVQCVVDHEAGLWLCPIFIFMVGTRYISFRTVFLMWCSAPIRNNGAAYIPIPTQYII